jgi:predicted nucleic acid-binding protein
MARALVLDNEPVQALLGPQHPKHRAAMAYLEVPALRNRRKAGSLSVVVPTTVRVEAGWDRSASRSATANRLPIADDALGTGSADRAAHLRDTLGISPADAHIGAVIQAAQGDISILTSDVDDLRRIVQQTGQPATVVRI